MKRSVSATVGLVLAALFGLFDVASLPLSDGQHPPMVVAVADAILGLVTVVGVILGWRGNRAGIVAVIVTRLLSALTAVPALFVDGVPAPIRVVAGIGIGVTLVAVALVAPMLRDRRGATVPAA